MNKEVLKRVMKKAHELRKENKNYVWALCLKYAWVLVKKTVTFDDFLNNDNLKSCNYKGHRIVKVGLTYMKGLLEELCNCDNSAMVFFKNGEKKFIEEPFKTRKSLLSALIYDCDYDTYYVYGKEFINTLF